MNTSENIAEVNDRMVRAGFPFYRETVWGTLGDMPLRTAVRMLLATHRRTDQLNIVDVGCGCGDDLLLFKKLLRLKDFSGDIQLHGCDLSHEMVQICAQRGLDKVGQADFLEKSTNIPKADLLWCHFVLIHIAPETLHRALAACAESTKPGGIVGLGFKTGNNETRLDPADGRIAINRTSSFHLPETVQNAAKELGLITRAKMQVPSDDPSYDYCWLITHKEL